MRAYPPNAARVARHRQLWSYFIYLSAAILPGGALLFALRWLWLRMHV